MNVVFMGTPEMAVPSLQALSEYPEIKVLSVYTQPDRPVGRHRKIESSPIKKYAQSLGIPVKTPEKVRNTEVIEELRKLNPALIIVCAYGQILPQSLLNIPEIGCFNLHFSFLPRWRGASPVQAALRYGDEYTGVSIQKVVRKLDAGPILASSKPELIRPDDNFEILGERLGKISAILLTDILPSLLEKKFTLEDQNENEVTFCRTIKKEEGKINWDDENAEDIERKLRAFTPWPGIFCFDSKGKRMVLNEVEIVRGSYNPGEVYQDFVIGAKQDAIKVKRLKPEGKKEMSAKDFFLGHSHFVGTIFK